MTPRLGNASEYPILVASKMRTRLDHARLDVSLRLRIKLRKHTKGVWLSPVEPGDAGAIAWIQTQAARWGTFRWTRTGWVHNKSKKDASVLP